MPYRVVPPGEVLFPSAGEQPNLELLAPLAGARWAIGSAQTIRWSGALNVTIEVVRGTTVAFTTTASGGSFIWTVSNLSLATDYFVRITDTASTASVSSGLFEIYRPTVVPLNAEITSLVPTFGLPGSTLVINGRNFGSSGSLTIAGLAATQVSWSDTRVEVIVPEVGAGSKPLLLSPDGNYVADGNWSFSVGEEEPPPPPPPVGGIKLADLVRSVNERIDNQVQYGRTKKIADGVTRHFYVADRYVRELPASDPDCLRCTTTDSDGNTSVVGSEGHFDYTSSWYHFDTDPAEGTVVTLDYSYQEYSETLIAHYINSALDYLFPDFYTVGVRDYSPASGEYVVDLGGQPAAGIIEVQYGSEGAWTRLTPVRDYRVLRGENQECLLTVFASVSGVVRVRAAFRPRHFNLTSDTLTSLGLPAEIEEPIILYAAWQTLRQLLVPRMRFDQAIITSSATVRDQQSSVQIYKALLDIETNKRRMRPWVTRGV